MPKVGETVTVVVANNSPSRHTFPNQPATITYRGIVVPPPSWYKEPEPVLAITSDAPEFEKAIWPFRVIAFSSMISLNGHSVIQQNKAQPIVVKVPSSKKGQPPYDVTLFPDGSAKCVCTGFKMRHSCRHPDEARKILKEAK